MDKNRSKYRDEILRMMYVAGEIGEPSVETTTLVEDIVRDQVVQVIATAGQLAARRGKSKFTIDDVLFQVRHDPGRLARLRNFMRWKLLRKRVKEDEAADELDLDEVDVLIGGEADAAATSPVDADPDADDDQSHLRHKKAGSGTTGPALEVPIPPLPWSTISFFPYASEVPGVAAIEDEFESGGGSAETELGPLPGSTSNPWLLARLLKNDERTKGMTAKEYATWSECRSASFTYRKKKTFREWCGLGMIADYKSTEDVLEILGFLTSEWVQSLTEHAVAAKEQEARAAKVGHVRERTRTKKKSVEGLFSMPFESSWEVRDGEQRAGSRLLVKAGLIQPRHVRRAFENLQTPPKKYTAMLNRTNLRQRKRLKLVSVWKI
ncbi:Transcription initiation protein spt3 [Madurella fahalii]|uniref:Transcription initiation protein spt3 n=1 Tax=Madurella fahalii TaxID=1157608 RepID=A0ABQ0GBZ0_9PEZI